jgi:UDP-N-acetylmuramate--alanine ligase
MLVNEVEQSWQERLQRQDKSLRVHLLGIGGAGMNAIAGVLIEQGCRVSGSDRQANAHTQRLAELGAHIYAQQTAANLLDLPADARPDVVLISSAVDANNPERQAAEQLGLPVVKRADFLSAMLLNRKVIAVAGAAGKSTTTAMIVKVLRDAGIEAGYIIGAELAGYGNAAAGNHDYFVIEADEYDHMFLGLKPAVAVITNVIWDHPDFYPTQESFWQAFRQFANLVAWDGLVVSCADDLGAEQLYEQRPLPGPCWITYGLDELADLRAVHLVQDGVHQRADLYWWHAPKGQLALSAPGAHNVCNALAALVVATWCDVPFRTALTSLQGFGGAARRFEHKGIIQGVTVIDDYAHHPTKVQATLAAARQRYPRQRIWAVMQPHTYSRTKQLLADFAKSFAQADRVIVTDIYAAREVDDGRVRSTDLVASSPHPHIQHIGDLAAAAQYLAQEVEAGDVVVVMGAGDSSQVAEQLIEHLRQSQAGA